MRPVETFVFNLGTVRMWVVLLRAPALGGSQNWSGHLGQDLGRGIRILRFFSSLFNELD